LSEIQAVPFNEYEWEGFEERVVDAVHCISC
jgi:hypothetical protein